MATNKPDARLPAPSGIPDTFNQDATNASATAQRLERAIVRAGQIAMRRFTSAAWRRHARLVALRSPDMIAQLERARGLR